MGRTFNAQGIGVLVQGLDHAVGQRAYGFAVLDCAPDDLVVNIGDIAHIGHLETTGFEPSLHDVKRNHGARMPQVAEVVHGHAADVHAHMAWDKR